MRNPMTPTIPSRPRFRPRLEALDDRITPALAFGTHQAFDTGGANPTAVAVADFNGDGRPDIAAVNGGANTVSVLVNTTPAGGTPTFTTTIGYLTGAGPGAVAVGDFNGDGRLDLVVANSASNTISVLLNTTPFGSATATFRGQQTFTVAANPAAVAVGDFNGDGRTDIAVSDGQLSVLLNTTPLGSISSAFSGAQAVATVASRGALAVGDFNGDGRADLATSDTVAVTGGVVNSVRVWTNTTVAGAANLSFGATAAYTGPVVATAVVFPLAVGDFDRDGRLDLAVTAGGNNMSVLANTTAGTFAPTFGGPQGFNFGAAVNGSASVADFDGDGRADLAAAAAGNVVSVLVNTTPAFTSALTFAVAQVYPVGANPAAVAAADFDGDGRAEAATANGGASTVSVLPNTSTGGTVTGPSLVGQFGSAGVWRYNRAGTWDQLTQSNATALASAPNGTVVANFPGAGVWYFNPASGWYQINGNQAAALDLDGLGNVYASFPGFGVAVYHQATGWSAVLTPSVADKIAVSANGTLAGNFPGFGVYRFTPATNWQRLSAVNALTLDVADSGDVAASFATYGVNLYRTTTGWQRINGYDANVVSFAGNGEVVASFPGFGVAKFILSIGYWQTLHNSLPAQTIATDLYGNVFASFAGYGLYEFNPYYGWRLRTQSATNLIGLGA